MIWVCLLLAAICLALVAATEAATRRTGATTPWTRVQAGRVLALIAYAGTVLAAGRVFAGDWPQSSAIVRYAGNATQWQLTFLWWGLALFLAWPLVRSMMTALAGVVVPLGWVTQLAIDAQGARRAQLGPPDRLAHPAYAQEPIGLIALVGTGVVAITLTLLRGHGWWLTLAVVPAGLVFGWAAMLSPYLPSD